LKIFGVLAAGTLISACTGEEGVYRQEIANDFAALATPGIVAEIIADNCSGIQERTGVMMMNPSEVGQKLGRKYASRDIRATLDAAESGGQLEANVTAYLNARGVPENDGPSLCAYGRSVAGQSSGVGAFLVAG